MWVSRMESMSGRMLVRMLMADTWDMVVFFRIFVTLVSAPPDVSVLQIKHGDAIVTDNLKILCNILYQGYFLSETL